MVVDRDEILSRIEGVLSRMDLGEGKGQLDENTGLLGKGVGLDSIEVIQLVAGLEEEFDLTIDDDDLLPEHFNSLGDLISFLEKNYLVKEDRYETL